MDKETLARIVLPYKIKEIDRYGTVGNRRESVAEHVCSAIFLAKHFLPQIHPALDELAVLHHILYHDLVEIHAGDTFILDDKHKETQAAREEAAFQKLRTDLSPHLVQEYEKRSLEFQTQSTREARFAKAIEQLDPTVHSIFKKKDWTDHGFAEAKYRAKKEHLFVEFPPILEFFDEIITWMRENEYFENGQE